MTRALGVIVLGAALCAVAAGFGTPSIAVAGAGLALLGIAALVWVGVSARARVERELGPARVEEEAPYPLRLRLRAPLPPPPGSEVDEPLLGEPLPARELRARGARVHVRFARRGRRTVAPAQLVVRDPLGLAQRVTATAAGEVLVLPRVEPVVLGSGGADGASSGVEGSRPADGAEVELDSLRPYRPGAPAARIHWPTVARTGEMVERRLVADTDLRPLVVLDSRRPESEAALDRAVRAAASLAFALGRRGGCAVLLPGDRRPADLDPAMHGWPALHARLALVEADARPPAPPRPGRRGVVFWVTADPAYVAGARAPRALARAGGERWLVSGAATPAARRPAGFTVAGCRGDRLGRAAARVAA